MVCGSAGPLWLCQRSRSQTRARYYHGDVLGWCTSCSAHAHSSGSSARAQGPRLRHWKASFFNVGILDRISGQMTPQFPGCVFLQVTYTQTWSSDDTLRSTTESHPVPWPQVLQTILPNSTNSIYKVRSTLSIIKLRIIQSFCLYIHIHW